MLASGRQAEALREELTRLICPDPEHEPPCPVPWSASYTDGADEPELDLRYGHLRGR
ncbi:hypothetical protein [Saccharopolyspora taberi]|uniref:hypothetical protein n=1 Tax=Saccharopolyspora taberi TaxID=60895 RepID=UPI0031E0C9B3